MANLPATRQAQVTVRDIIIRNQGEIAKALPKQFTAERFTRIVLNTIQKIPNLLNADPKSLIGSVMQCAQLGLEPDNGLGSVYLIPFWNSKRDNFDVQVIIGYRGLIELALRSGAVININAHVVYEKEKYKYELGLKPILKHAPLSPDKRGEKKVAAYAVAILSDGTEVFQWLWSAEIDKIKELSKSYYFIDKKTGAKTVNEKSIWFLYEDDMYKKTAIRRLCKYLPLSPELIKAATMDEAQEAGEDISAFTEITFDDTPTYSFPPELMTDVEALCDILGINNAEKSMKLAGMKGNEDKLRAWISELNQKAVDLTQEKAVDLTQEKSKATAKPPKEETKQGLL